MDQGFGEVRGLAYSGVSVKGARSHASCLPSGLKAGAESLLVEGEGNVSVCVERLYSARRVWDSSLSSRRRLMKASVLPSGLNVSCEAEPRS
jgi:hypothetical protein